MKRTLILFFAVMVLCSTASAAFLYTSLDYDKSPVAGTTIDPGTTFRIMALRLSTGFDTPPDIGFRLESLSFGFEGDGGPVEFIGLFRVNEGQGGFLIGSSGSLNHTFTWESGFGPLFAQGSPLDVEIFGTYTIGDATHGGIYTPSLTGGTARGVNSGSILTAFTTGGNYVILADTETVSETPEPGTTWLLISGGLLLIGVGVFRRRNRWV